MKRSRIILLHLLQIFSLGWTIRYLQRSQTVSADWLIKHKDE